MGQAHNSNRGQGREPPVRVWRVRGDAAAVGAAGVRDRAARAGPGVAQRRPRHVGLRGGGQTRAGGQGARQLGTCPQVWRRPRLARSRPETDLTWRAAMDRAEGGVELQERLGQRKKREVEEDDAVPPVIQIEEERATYIETRHG